MNILHVIHRYYPYIGGSERYFQVISERLARDKHSVNVYTTDAWDLEHFWVRGRRQVAGRSDMHEGVCITRYPVQYLPFTPYSYQGLRFAMAQASRLPLDVTPALFFVSRFTPYVPELERALDVSAEAVDLVHVANVAFDSLLLAAYRFARRRKIPIIVTPFIHLGEANDKRTRQYYLMQHQLKVLRHADAVIVQTGLESDELARHGIAPAKMHRIGVGIAPEELQGGDAQRLIVKYNIQPPVVFILGTTAFDKGTFHLVAAMDKLWEQGRNATLVIAGPTTSAFEQFFAAQSSRVKHNTRVLGFVPPEDYRDLLAAGDVLAMPSRTDSFGIVFLEAWFYGKPVIGARAGGVPEVIDDGRDGFLVNFGDTDMLARRIAQLLDDRVLAQEFGAAGREKVLQNWTWDKIYPQIEKLYHQLGGKS